MLECNKLPVKGNDKNHTVGWVVGMELGLRKRWGDGWEREMGWEWDPGHMYMHAH